MFDQTKNGVFGRAAKFFGLNHTYDLNKDDVEAAREFIASYWPKLTRHHTKDDGSALGLPNPYLVPAFEEGREFDFNEMYYWDSYFMVQGMWDIKHKDFVIGILEDMFSLFKRFHTIPNASRTYLTGRSQPPLLSAFIFDIYNIFDMDSDWLNQSLEIAKQEYRTVWLGTAKPNARQVHQGLSRYYDINMTHDLAETESGWDYTPRFNRRCLDYLPVDLNALLYRYERDFARAARLADNKEESEHWRMAAEQRRQTMNKLMWDSSRGLYYDYDYTKGKRGNVSSLASFFPMWVGMVDEPQANELVKALRRFEENGGLTTTDSLPFGQYVRGAMPVQWAYPNGWAPLHFVVVQALQRYGYHDDARRIAMKWLRTNLDWFNKHGNFLEKYNVVDPHEPPVKGVYPTQSGFGWTNAIFERFCREFIDGMPQS